MAEIYRVRFYGDDGTTVIAEFSTDPLHARPYLRVPENLAAQEINFGAGRATIGSMQIEVVDVPITLGNQSTGYVTSKLPDAAGLSALMGRRAHVELWDGAAFQNVMNAVVDDILLHDSFSSYIFGLKDQRENERRTRAFVEAATSSVLPRGVIDGFGIGADGITWLVPPTEPLTGTYAELDETVFSMTLESGLIYFDSPELVSGKSRPEANRIVTDKMMEAFRLTQADDGMRYDRIRLLWRYPAGAWNVIEKPLYKFGYAFQPLSGVWRANERDTEVQFIDRFWWFREAGQPHPTHDSTVEVIFGYAGPPSENYPLHFEGTLGGLLAALLDGDYSGEGTAPVTIYDAAVVAAMTEPVRMRITEPLDDDNGIWKWVEDNIYAPFGYAPTLDADGEISPINYKLPPVGADLERLDDDNCEPIAGWNHTGSDAINVVSVEYKRLYRATAEMDPAGTIAGGDGIVEQKVTVEHRNIASIAFMGERPLEIKADTLCAIGGELGAPFTGEAADEQGAQMAAARTREATDRFLLGGIHLAARVMRSSVGELRAGQWIVGACPWWPAYESGERGPDRLAQLVRVRVLNSKWYEVEAIDAGPDGAAVLQPTINEAGVTVAIDGAVTIPVSAVPAGSEARIEYALSTLEPAATSPLWRFVSPRLTAAGSVVTPPNPSGAIVWIRGRGEKEGKRPSAWTTAFDVTVGTYPRLLSFHILRTTGGELKAIWTKNAATQGVRLYYESHAGNENPAPSLYVDVDADDLEYTFDEADTDAGPFFTVQPVPYTGFSGGAVSGTAGARSSRTVAGTAEGAESLMAPALSPGAISEDYGTQIASFTAIVHDPFGVATRLLNKKRIGGGEWPAVWSVTDATPMNGDEHIETVAMIEGHPSEILFGLEYDIPGVSSPYLLPIFPLLSPTFDMGFVANVTGASIEFADDGEALITATADYDTVDDGIEDSIIFTVDEDADPAAPTIIAHDGAIIGRMGTGASGVTVAVGANAHVLLAAISPDGVVGPVFGPIVKRRVGEVSGPGAGGITAFSVWRSNTDVGDPINMKSTYAATGSTGWYVELEEYDILTETTRTIFDEADGEPLSQVQYPFSNANYLQAAKNAGDYNVDLLYTLSLYNNLDVLQDSETYSVTMTDVDEPL